MAAAPEQYLAVVFTGDSIAAALWQQLHAHTTILARSKCILLASLKMHDINKAVDTALDELGEAGASVKFVLFGVPNTWVDAEGLTADKKTILKTLTQDLLLEPLGYVANHDALAAAERDKSGQSFSGLFILPSEHYIDVDRYVQGNLTQSEHIGRSGETVQDAAEMVARLQATQHPKERWILVEGSNEGEANDLEQAIAEKLGRPLELMTCDQVVQTVVTTGGGETLALKNGTAPQAPAVEAAPTTHAALHEVPAHQPIATIGDDDEFQVPSFAAQAIPHTATPPLEGELLNDAPSFTIHGATSTDNFSVNPDDELQDVTDEFPSLQENSHSHQSKFKLPNISSQLSRVLILTKGNAKIGGVVFILFILFASGAAGYWNLSRSYKAQINVWLKTDTLRETREFMILAEGQSATASMSGLQAQSISETITLDKEVPATGNKIVGDSAKGKITIYNRTTQEKTFPAGTLLVFEKYRFTLDQEVKVASASSGNDYTIVPGTKDGTVTASQIGTESNLDKNKEFAIGNFATSSYVAKNAEPFGGGTSREVQSVAKKDIDTATNDLLQAATTQLKEKIEAQNTQESPVLFTNQVKITKSQASAKVGDEQKFVKVTLDVEGQGLRIPPEELKRVAQETFGSEMSGDRMIQPDSTQITTEGITGTDGNLRLQAVLTTQALPKISGSELQAKLAGQHVSRADTILREHPGVAKSEILFQPAWISNLFKEIPESTERVQLNIRLQETP